MLVEKRTVRPSAEESPNSGVSMHPPSTSGYVVSSVTVLPARS